MSLKALVHEVAMLREELIDISIYMLRTDLKPLAHIKAGQPDYKPASQFQSRPRHSTICEARACISCARVLFKGQRLNS